jgi:hypothetical protein
VRQKEKERIGRFTVDFFDYCALAIFTIIDAVKVVAEKKRRKKKLNRRAERRFTS